MRQEEAERVALIRRARARWESKGGKHFFNLYRDGYGYGYTCSGGMGHFGSTFADDDAAIAYVLASGKVASSQPDANTTPMRRVY